MIGNIENDLSLLLSTILEKSITNIHSLNENNLLNVFLSKIFNDELIDQEQSMDWELFKNLLQQRLFQNGYKMTLEFDIKQINQNNTDFVIAALLQALSVYKLFNEFQFDQNINLLNYQSKNCIEEVIKEMIKEIEIHQIETKQQKNEIIESLYKKIEQQEKTIFKFKNLNFEAQNEISKLKFALQNQSSSNQKLQKDLKRLSLLHSDSLKSYDEQKIQSVDSFDEFQELKIQNTELKNQLQQKINQEQEYLQLKAKVQKMQKDFDDIIEQKEFYKNQQNEFEKLFSENQINKNLIIKYQNDISNKSEKYFIAKEKIQDLKNYIQQLEIKLQSKEKQIQTHIDKELVLKEFSLTRINSIDDEVFINELQDENNYLRQKLNKSKIEKQLDFENIPKQNNFIKYKKNKKETSIDKIMNNKSTPFKKNSLQIFMEENNCVFQNKKSTFAKNKKLTLQCNCSENMQLLYEICADTISQDIMSKQKLMPQRLDRNRNIIKKFCYQNLLHKENLRQFNQSIHLNQNFFIFKDQLLLNKPFNLFIFLFLFQQFLCIGQFYFMKYLQRS